MIQVIVERRPGSVVALDIEVPTEQVERAHRARLQAAGAARQSAWLQAGQGAPNILEQRIGWPALREQAIELLVPEAVTQAVTEQQLQAIETPRDQVEAFERLQPARLKAEVTAKPEVSLPDYHAINVPVPDIEVGEAHLEEAIDALRERFGELVPAANRPVQKDDQVVIDLEVLHEGLPADDQPTADQQLDVQQDRLIPGLYEGLLGISQGETRDIQLTLPEDYRRTELAGKEVVFRVTVKEIKARVLPPVDDELARMSGTAENVDDLRRILTSGSAPSPSGTPSSRQQKDALDALVAGTTVDLPEVLVHGEIDREIRNLALDLQRQGIDFEQLSRFGGLDVEKMHEEARRPGRRPRAPGAGPGGAGRGRADRPERRAH